MKQSYSLKRPLSVLVLLMASTLTWAYDFEMDGIYYNIIGDANVEVTYKEYLYSYSTSEYRGNIVIPSTITYGDKTYNVTSIGDYAFKDCYSLTSINIPESVTSIGNYAFGDCI